MLIGAGNAAWHLGHALLNSEIRVQLLYNRDKDRGLKLASEINCKFSTDLAEAKTSDLIIVAVNDAAISEVLERLPGIPGTIVHCSGSIGMNVLSNYSNSYGVFYPFQTFTSGVELDFRKVPVCIEASDSITLELLWQLAHKLSDTVRELNSEQRRKLHLSGAIANNFSNHLFSLASDYLTENNLDRELLLPLIAETVNKLKQLSAREAQTGPARRQNKEIINEHLNMLDNKPELKNLYSLISDSIIAYYSSK